MNSAGNLKRQLWISHRHFSTSFRDGGRRDPSPARAVRIWRASHFSAAGLLLLLMAAVVAAPARSFGAQLAISIRIGPPALPVYAQPLCPGPGYIWTPGYWAYDPADGYYWVPGTWVLPPEPGFLWTPGYWGWSGGLFMWHAGYWGLHVGFYGGINYGFGYTGVGYAGGYWRGGAFFYNRSVNNINVVNIRNVYTHEVIHNASVTRVAYSGGPGGIAARPTAAEMTAEHERHIEATSVQQQHQSLARQDRSQFASVNHGKPSVAASARPGQFQARSVERAGGAAAHPSRTGTPDRSFERTQGRPASVERPAHTPPQRESATLNRKAEKSQARTPSAESRPARSAASHAAAPSHNGGGRAPAEEHRSNPSEERKQPARNSEPHR